MSICNGTVTKGTNGDCRAFIFVFEIPFCLPVLEYRLAGSGTVCQGAPVASGILDTVLFSLEVPLSVHTAKRILFCGQDL